MSYTRDDYPKGEVDEYPWVPDAGDEAYWGTYKVTVEEVEVENRRALVSTNSEDWEGHVALYHLSEEPGQYDGDYPFKE